MQKSCYKSCFKYLNFFKRWSKPHILYDDLLNCYANLERNPLYALLPKRKMFRMKNVEENMSDIVGHVTFLSVFLFFPRQLK